MHFWSVLTLFIVLICLGQCAETKPAYEQDKDQRSYQCYDGAPDDHPCGSVKESPPPDA